ncbi:MAG: GTPase Era [Candidatus Aminicenantes bacterium]|nr:GTPase Era [Candidatus Aminicenantes bacterium]
MKKGKSRHSGYVALLGRTNVGKSTFINALLKTKVAIVSDKPQTTRRRILAIKTSERGQIVFFDCPGIHKPHFKLNELMMKAVNDALADADLILYFIDLAFPKQDDFVISLLEKAGKKVFLVINKIDKLNKGKVLEKIQHEKDLFPWQEIVPISALRGDNLDLIEELIFACLPEGENFFPDDEYTQQSENFFIGELIRENMLPWIEDELPFSTTIKVAEIKDRGEVVLVRAEIFVESSSQKKIIIGKNGRMIKQIGQTARQTLEAYYEKKVFLDLFVKIVPGWRNSYQVIQEILR